MKSPFAVAAFTANEQRPAFISIRGGNPHVTSDAFVGVNFYMSPKEAEALATELAEAVQQARGAKDEVAA